MSIAEYANQLGIPCDTLMGRLEDIERGLEAVAHIADSPDQDKRGALHFVQIALWEHVRAVKTCAAQAGFNPACPTVYSD